MFVRFAFNVADMIQPPRAREYDRLLMQRPGQTTNADGSSRGEIEAS